MRDRPRPGVEPVSPSAGGFLTTGRPVKSLAPKLVKEKGNRWLTSSLLISRPAETFNTQEPTPANCSELPLNGMFLPSYLNCGSHHSEINYRLVFRGVNQVWGLLHAEKKYFYPGVFSASSTPRRWAQSNPFQEGWWWLYCLTGFPVLWKQM